MTDPEGTAQDVSGAPAVPQTPVTAQGLVTQPDLVSRPPAASVTPRRRRRRTVFLITAGVLVLAAGLAVWAPWLPPPVLRPAGLVAGPATANSITVSWSRPRTGPLPDKYLILGSGAVISSVAGTVTSYRDVGLTPGASYLYHLVAVRDGIRSPQSALFTAHTRTPPVSQARMQGSWQVYAKNIGHAPGGENGNMTWQLSPACATGACDVMLHVQDGKFSFAMKLTRAGAVYQGHADAGRGRCGPAGSSIPDPTTVKIKIRLTGALGETQEWAATSLTGTMAGTSQRVSAAGFFCNGSTFRASLTGGPA